jgi:hypothetical protein
MKQHKWHKEIKAWADGAEIEIRYTSGAGSASGWMIVDSHTDWDFEHCEYRIKPQPKESRLIKEMKEAIEDLRKSLGNERIEQPKEPKYLYVHIHPQNSSLVLTEYDDNYGDYYVGKIKLEETDNG